MRCHDVVRQSLPLYRKVDITCSSTFIASVKSSSIGPSLICHISYYRHPEQWESGNVLFQVRVPDKRFASEGHRVSSGLTLDAELSLQC